MSQRVLLRRFVSTTSLLLAAGFTGGLGLSACGQSSEGGSEPAPPAVDGATGFISHVPGESGNRNGDGGVEGPVAEDGDANGGADPGAPPSPERAISEADILKVEGDTLYALSRYSGMTIIDLSDPTQLRVLGNYRSTA